MSMIKARTDNSEKLIFWGGDDPFTHTLVTGPTRCGKTSTVLYPLVFEMLKAKRAGKPVGISVIEPKSDLVRDIREMVIKMGLEDQMVYIDPERPEISQRINVMKGDKNDVAEATVTVLKSLFGKQDAFFATVQELSSRKVTLLLKELYGDNMDIMDVLANLRDSNLLKKNVEKLRQQKGGSDLVQFFDNELLGTGNMAEKYRQFIVGLRSQLENITSNEHLSAVITGKSDIDLDEHLEKGGILLVNTSMGRLGAAGDGFGMFIAMHLQLATFRRKGTERTRVPHYLMFDEFSRYINPDIERFLSAAASYRVALIAAIQSFSQLEIESGKLKPTAMKNAILTSTRNKIVFGGLEERDAEEASRIMGKEELIRRTRTYSGGILENILPKMYKDDEQEVAKFSASFIMSNMPRFHYMFKLVQSGQSTEPGLGVGDFVPRDWYERMIEEDEKVLRDRKPSILKLRERAKYNVQKYRLLKEKEKEEKRKQIFAEDPFSKPAITPEAEDTQVLNENQKTSKDITTKRSQKEKTPAAAATPFVFDMKDDNESDAQKYATFHDELPKEVFESKIEKTDEVESTEINGHSDEYDSSEFIYSDSDDSLDDYEAYEAIEEDESESFEAGVDDEAAETYW